MTCSIDMMKRDRFIVMLGSDFLSLGGVTAVVQSYLDGGLFDRWPIRFLSTYRRDNLVDKLLTASRALAIFSVWLITGRVAAVHAHTSAKGSFWRKSIFLLLCKASGGKAILHMHDGYFPSFYQERCGATARWAVRFVLARMDRVLVLTPGWETIIRDIEPRARLTVIPNSVVPLTVPCLPEAGQILFLGRLRQEKGIFDLIKAAAIVIKTFPDTKFVCAGDGDIPALKTLINRSGLVDNFEFPGWVAGDDKEALLAKAAVFVLPSYFEGLPIGVLEAMVNGIPVVATDVGGIAEALGDRAGILVEPGQSTELAAALMRLLGDVTLRERMGQAGKQRAESEFKQQVVLDRIGTLYNQLGFSPKAAGPDFEMKAGG